MSVAIESRNTPEDKKSPEVSGMPTAGAQRVTVLQPTTGWAALNLAELWLYRDLLFALATRDVKLRYRQTILGVVWVLLQPLFAAGIFSIVFGRLANLPTDGVPSFLFSFTSMLAWSAFSLTLSKVSMCLVGNSHLVTKIYFPRLALPLSLVASTLIDFGVGLLLLPILMVITHTAPSLTVFLMPIALMLILLLALGIGLYAAALTVSYRDIQYVLPVLLGFAMYATPIGYSVQTIGEKFGTNVVTAYFLLNPLASLIALFRWSILGTRIAAHRLYPLRRRLQRRTHYPRHIRVSAKWSVASPMSSDTAIRMEGLSKSYTIAHNAARSTTVAEALVRRLRNPARKER